MEDKGGWNVGWRGREIKLERLRHAPENSRFTKHREWILFQNGLEQMGLPLKGFVDARKKNVNNINPGTKRK